MLWTTWILGKPIPLALKVCKTMEIWFHVTNVHVIIYMLQVNIFLLVSDKAGHKTNLWPIVCFWYDMHHVYTFWWHKVVYDNYVIKLPWTIFLLSLYMWSVSLPRLVDFDWRVDTKMASDSVSRMSVPTCILQMKVQDVPSQVCGKTRKQITGLRDDTIRYYKIIMCKFLIHNSIN